MKIKGKQSFKNYEYLQKYILWQSKAGARGRSQIRNFKIAGVILLLLSVALLIGGVYLLFTLSIFLGIWFCLYPYYLNWLLDRSIARSYNAYIASVDGDVSIELNENNIEIVQDTITISSKTSDFKSYIETTRAIIIHLSGALYCSVFREETDNWADIVSEIKAYAEKNNTPYITNHTWSEKAYGK